MAIKRDFHRGRFRRCTPTGIAPLNSEMGSIEITKTATSGDLIEEAMSLTRLSI
jgi:hypothetical protein